MWSVFSSVLWTLNGYKGAVTLSGDKILFGAFLLKLHTSLHVFFFSTKLRSTESDGALVQQGNFVLNYSKRVIFQIEMLLV
jgi:hypothetical protein